MEFLNQTIGRYQLMRVIGEGGVACVYEGVHEKLGTRVAVKVLNPLLARNPQLRLRFENEANFMASLNFCFYFCVHLLFKTNHDQ